MFFAAESEHPQADTTFLEYFQAVPEEKCDNKKGVMQTDEITGEQNYKEMIMGGSQGSNYLSLYASNHNVTVNQREMVCRREFESNPEFKANFSTTAKEFCNYEKFDKMCNKPADVVDSED